VIPTIPTVRPRVENTTLDTGTQLEVARIVELGRSLYTGNELLASREAEPAGAKADAIRFLHEELKHGPRPTNELKSAAEEAGLAWETVRHNKAAARVVSVKTRGVKNGAWLWKLTETPPSEELAAA
jgi:hypothetical protein